jgi:preprotein translocase subunit SecY
MASAAEQLAANMNFGAFQKATELHKRLWFTLGALIVYRLGTYIPIPGIDHDAFVKAFETQSQGMLGMFNMFSGGAVQRMAIFSLNVMPYISASIIVQLLGTIYGPWEKLRKEGGEAGRKQLNQYTRYLTVVLAIAQAFGIAVGLQNSNLAVHPGIFFLVATITTLTGGTLFLMWLGEQITSRGVGNGSSLIIFAGIVAGIPSSIAQILELTRQGQVNGFLVLLLAVAAVAVIAFIVFMERSQRRLLVQYPKRQQAGGRVVGGENSFMPLKLNASGVIPPIFASSLLLLPTTALGFLPKGGTQSPVMQWIQGAVAQLQHGHLAFIIAYAVMIIFFTFFYTSVIFNPEETAENLRKYGGFLPGIRPGKRTADYIDYVVTRLTVIGAAYITAVCLLPEVFSSFFGRAQFGGTTLLIVVSVTMDTVAQIQSHLLAHQYEGLIKKAKLRGRGR